MAVWLITGTSKGLGRALADEAVARGHNVAALSRTGTGGDWPREQVLNLTADVTDPASVTSAVAQVRDRFGRIDVLVNNAGAGLIGAVEEASDDEIRAQLELNFIAPLRLARAVLPMFRKQQSGLLVSISSLAVPAGASSWGVYAAAKAALETATEAIAKEAAPFGVRTLIVQPGILRTAFLDDGTLAASASVIGDYEAQATARAAVPGTRGNQPGDPVLAAQLLAETIDSGDFSERIQLGDDALRVAAARVDRLGSQLEHWRKSVRPIGIG